MIIWYAGSEMALNCFLMVVVCPFWLSRHVTPNFDYVRTNARVAGSPDEGGESLFVE